MKHIKLFESFDEVDVPGEILSEEPTSVKPALIGSFGPEDNAKFVQAIKGINHRWPLKEQNYWNLYVKSGKILNLFKQGDKYIAALYVLEGLEYKVENARDNDDKPVKGENGSWV
jgi:hypothetical protein